MIHHCQDDDTVLIFDPETNAVTEALGEEHKFGERTWRLAAGNAPRGRAP